MSFQELFAVFGWFFALCTVLIAVVGVATLLIGAYIGINVLIDRHQQAKRRQMATPMERDDLMLRRLKKSVAIRISTRKLANKGFTLIELIIVLAIIGTLCWVVLTSIDKAVKAKAQFMAQCHYPKPACEDMWKNNK